jgi:hypothetical protein
VTRRHALAELPDLINQALEVYENEDRLISVNMYDIPTFIRIPDYPAGKLISGM